FFFRITVLNDEITDEEGGRRRAPRPGEFPQVAGPERLAVHAVSVEAALAEEGDDRLAVGGTGRRRPAVHGVALLWPALPGDVFPQELAVLAVHAEDHALLAVLQRRRQEDALAPNDGRRLPPALEW